MKVDNTVLSTNQRSNGFVLKIGDAAIIPPATSVSHITGTLYQENNMNCQTDPAEPYLSGKVVKAMPGPYYTLSDSAGHYDLILPVNLVSNPLNYTVQAIPVNHYTYRATPVCPENNMYVVSLGILPDTLNGKNFGYEFTECHYMDVQIASNMRRRCFANSTSVTYTNRGVLMATDAYILVEFPEYVVPKRSSRPWEYAGNNIYRFNLGNVAPGQAGFISITDSVLCDDVGILGISQCIKATAFPAPDCPPDAAWNGAEIGVDGVCEDGFARFSIFNKSTADMSDSVEVTIYIDSILVYGSKAKLIAGDTLRLQAFTEGRSAHLTTNQVAHHPLESFVTATVEACTEDGTHVPSAIVNHFPIPQRPNSKTQCLPVIGAYDPNDKQVFPSGFTQHNIVAPGTPLEYLIRFQNTGNDTAFTVYILDTLSVHLNPETIEPGAASHPYELSMQTDKNGKTALRWQFNNINLPDSSTNQVGSNGFVQFRIRPYDDLPLGTQVFNYAGIYFDFNPPIITNQTKTTYDLITFRDSTLDGVVQVITGLMNQSYLSQETGAKLYPNPVTRGELTAEFSSRGSITLYNSLGQQVYRKTNMEGRQNIPLQLHPGIYIARIETAKGMAAQKIVVQ